MVGMLLARVDRGAPAVAAPGRATLDYGGLAGLVERVASGLASAGIGPGDAVALVAPNGPEALAATLAVADAAAVAPLNPALAEAEFRFLLRDLRARALLLAGEASGGAARAAREAGIPLLEIRPDPTGAAGRFDLECAAGQPAAPAFERRDPSIALLLHTSGTTARPKLVALRREALALSARAIARGLALTPRDRCLNVMPLFHVHGLVGAALSSIAAGAAVCCTPGFDPLRFRRWLIECGATWYSAVPSMHQAIAARLRGGDGSPRPPGPALRLARSCSSPLPARVRAALSACLEVPVVNAYGMTEAAHQVASTKADDAGKAGGVCPVGLSSGPAVGVLDESGRWLPPGSPGEILLRGETVITAYEQPDEANLRSFHDGWLRTGDEGVVAAGGEITLTGRIKELINAAGEKVSPYEVEDALLSHPSVAEAVCFAVPDRSRGESVGAAVVLAAGACADERALRRFVAERLAPCKVPERVLTLGALPKGPTGKLQRVGLAAALGLGS
ncbi:MAG: AMP-dependent synthetase and ligase [Acidobacteria bacterium]|nr:AMP-dependent synthetase and ligase [Acidobacteriota bacterium]